MMKVIKHQGKQVQAYRLGEEHPVLRQLMEQGRIIKREDGQFEVFSQEALQGGTAHGQLAQAGDFIKLDSAGFPYPNDAAFFQKNHRHISGDHYEQMPKPLDAWTADQPMCPEVEFLIKQKGLTVDESSQDACFSAPLWGTREVAARDAVLIFYSITCGTDGAIKDADFNFVSRSEFEKTYHII